MKTWQYNGEYWFFENHSLFKRIRTWFVWFGGWEKANQTGWKFTWRGYGNKLKFHDPFPLSFFGHRLTFYGKWWNIRIGGGWFVKSASMKHTYFWSINGTPDSAVKWYFNCPKDVRDQVK